MARITVEDCLKKEQNRFKLVLLASKRAKQLSLGSEALINGNNKATVTALREIAAGLVTAENIDSLNAVKPLVSGSRDYSISEKGKITEEEIQEELNSLEMDSLMNKEDQTVED